MPANQRQRVDAFIGLGANLGDRRQTIDNALQALDNLSGTDLVAVSDLYETAACFVEDQPDFLNGCAHLKTSLPAPELMDHLLAIEQELGRVRTIQNGPRTIDLDLLLYGQEVIDDEGLTVPHPDMHNREFVLRPLSDIAAQVTHPRLKLTITELLKALE